MKNIYFIGAVLLAIGVGSYFFASEKSQLQESVFDGKNITFTVDGESVSLANGEARTPIENSSAQVTTRYFGSEASGDLNGDGFADHAFVVTQNSGGSGTFYYVVVALSDDDVYKTTNAFFIGDRIAPETTEIRADVRELHVKYADRGRQQPMTTPPSEDKILLLKVTPAGVLEGLMR